LLIEWRHFKKSPIFAALVARMAELVDALVSNTCVFGHAGSTPAPGTVTSKSLSAMRGFFYAKEKEAG